MMTGMGFPLKLAVHTLYSPAAPRPHVAGAGSLQLAGQQVGALSEGPLALLTPSFRGTVADMILGEALADSHRCSKVRW